MFLYFDKAFFTFIGYSSISLTSPLLWPKTILDDIRMREILFWIWILFGLWALYTFVKMAIPKVKEVYALGKKRAWFLDSRITHKVAELLIWIPFHIIILWTIKYPAQAILPFIDHTEEIMVFGGILAGYSFFDARGKYWWAWAIWLLFLWGVFGGWMARNWVIVWAT